MRLGFGQLSRVTRDLAERAERVGLVCALLVRSCKFEGPRARRKSIRGAVHDKVSFTDICETKRMSRSKSASFGNPDALLEDSDPLVGAVLESQCVAEMQGHIGEANRTVGKCACSQRALE